MVPLPVVVAAAPTAAASPDSSSTRGGSVTPPPLVGWAVFVHWATAMAMVGFVVVGWEMTWPLTPALITVRGVVVRWGLHLRGVPPRLPRPPLLPIELPLVLPVWEGLEMIAARKMMR